MSFDNPNLVYLEYSDFVQLLYPVVNLDSLVEAKLRLTMNEGGPKNCDPSNLIEGLRNVEILNLSCPETVEVIVVLLSAFDPKIGFMKTSSFCFCFRFLGSSMKQCLSSKTSFIYLSHLKWTSVHLSLLYHLC